ncbi:MAG: NAD-dependent deacylase [Anaerolineae bacterium]
MVNDKIRIAAALLANSHSGVALTGAGISTPSGIPDFRSPKSGLWSDIDPLAVASIYGFRQNPSAFYEWIYPFLDIMLNAKPNAAHLALATLESWGILNSIVTQNLDTLHTRAGSQIVYELHGHIRELTCIHCFTVYDANPVISQFLKNREVPHCTKCEAILKPNVILFGEQLPVNVYIAAKEAVRKSDVLLIIGTSLEVAPASELPLIACRNNAKIIIINRETTYFDSRATVVINGDAAEILPQIMSCMEAVG